MLLPHDIDVLVVESQATMRAQLRNMLTSIGIEAPQFAVSATMAMRRLRAQRFDLVLCEYNLGEGQDGQHLLEDLRQHRIIPRDTLFVMITAERNYERVTSACELAPDDYILKPLTAETLRVRLLRALEKRDAFLPAWQLMKIGDPVGAIDYCRIARNEHPQHLVDFMRLQAELHAGIGQIAEAETLYREILAARPIPWASLGLARMLVVKKSWVEAEHILTELLARHDRFIEAYELLARLRHLGELALNAGDPATAERSLVDVVERGKYSEFREPEDHVRLLQAQLALHKLADARETLDDLERGLGRHPKGELCAAIGGALIQAHVHDHTAARQSMLSALRNPARLRDLSVGLRQDLVKACYDQQMRDEGTELLADLIRTAGDDRTLESTRAALRSRGLDQVSREVEAKVQAEVKSLVTTGAQKAHAGDFDGAVAEMMNAARKMPGNPHVLFNAALALLRHIENRGWNEAFAAQASALIERAQRLSPANPRLTAITEFMHELMKRFGIAPGRPQPKPRPA